MLGAVCNIAGEKIDCSKAKTAKGEIAKVIARWNAEFKDSPAAIGPRTIGVGEAESGELIVGTQRTFISEVALDGRFEVAVTKRNGKAADIEICSIDGRGKMNKIGGLSFDKDDTGSKSKTISVDGRVLVVKLDADKLNKFGYSVKITEK